MPEKHNRLRTQASPASQAARAQTPGHQASAHRPARAAAKRRPTRKTAEVPQWDQAAAARVVKRVHFKNIELLGAHFERSDDRPIPQESLSDTPPDIGINVAW